MTTEPNQDLDYERILKGEAKLHLVGDLGLFFPLPFPQELTNKERLYILQKYALNPEGTAGKIHGGGQVICSLLNLGVVAVTCIDYAPDTYCDFLIRTLNDKTGKQGELDYFAYIQLEHTLWGVKDSLNVTIQNTINAISEESPEDIVYDARDRTWYSDFFSDFLDINVKLVAAADDYLTDQEKQAIMEHRRKREQQLLDMQKGSDPEIIQ